MIETLSPEDARAFLTAHRAVRYVDLYVIDLAGTARGKRITAEKLVDACRDGVYLPLSIFASDVLGNPVESTGLGIRSGDKDYLCRPRARSLVAAPWDKSLALCELAMLEQSGAPVFADPRHVLENVVARLAAMSLTPALAFEMEFFVFRDPAHAADDAAAPLAPPRGIRSRGIHHQSQVYGLAELDDFAPFLDAVRQAAAVLEVPVESITSEYGPGQLEINVQYRADAVRAAVDALLLKRTIRTLAPDHGLIATFMAKPREDLSGNGMHVHMSLRDRNGANVFDGEPTPNAALAHAIAGLLATRADFMIAFAPHANSYRRFQSYSYAPIRDDWGLNNRSVAVRIPTARGPATRFEHRIASADANPYLLAAAILAGVHHGLTEQRLPPPATAGDSYSGAPVRAPSWETAIDAFAASAVATRYFSRPFVDLLIGVKRHEWLAYHRPVPEQDYRWYL